MAWALTSREVVQFDRSAENDAAYANMKLISVAETLHCPIFLPEKADAFWNIPLVVLTWETSQREMSWLNECAPANMRDMSKTLLVSQREMSWLNECAPENMPFIEVTRPRDRHWDKFPEKDSARANIKLTSSAALRSQPEIFPLKLVAS